jgi:mycothiol synthase
MAIDVDRLVWRPIGPADAAPWAHLLAGIRAVDRSWDYLTEDDLLENFDDPDRDFARGSVGVHDGVVMVGYGALQLRTSAEPAHEMRWEGGVHPDYRRRGIGSRLHEWAESTARPLHAERFPGRALDLSGTCMSHNADAVALYSALGYRPVRWFHAMELSLAPALPAAPAPVGVEIVALTTDRFSDALRIRNEAFHDHWGSTEMTSEAWAHFMGSGVFRPNLSFVADEADESLGFVISHEYGAYNADAGIRDVYIALVGTVRAARRRGIGTALMTRALTEARSAGFKQASLGVDVDSLTGALALYERLGFVTDHTSITQTKTYSSTSTSRSVRDDSAALPLSGAGPDTAS